MAYFDLINARGGIHGRRISIRLRDDHYEPDPAVSNTHEFIKRGDTLFLFDYVGTPTLTRVLPLLKYYEEQNIVNVAPFTGAQPQRTPPYDRYVFNIRASYIDEARCLVDYFYAKGYRHIGFCGQADAYGKSGEVAVNRALARHGLSLVAAVSYRRNQEFAVRMDRQVALLHARGADAVIAFGVYEPCAAFIRDARLAGWSIPIANVSFVGSSKLLQTLSAAAKTLHCDLTSHLFCSQVVPSPDDLTYPLVKAYRSRVRTRDGDSISLEGWLNAVVVVEALRRAGPQPTRQGFIRALESLHGWDPGMGVKLGFSHICHEGTHRVWLMRVANERWVQEYKGGGI
jgi:ABC-type branched-subunit amino acid transport system substrate-binding protein